MIILTGRTGRRATRTTLVPGTQPNRTVIRSVEPAAVVKRHHSTERTFRTMWSYCPDLTGGSHGIAVDRLEIGHKADDIAIFS